VQFAGGRIALRRAAEKLGLNAPPFLSNPRGAPVVPAGWVASVSHKRTLAVGMVARSQEGTLGVDLEDYEPRRLSVARSVLTAKELAEIEPLPEDRRWMSILVRFSIKESIYKALDPYVGRYVGFKEAEVEPRLDGGATVRLFLTEGEGPFETEARYQWLEGRLLTSARIRRR
jgi:4'-phosphopantetheinyl transferase EntD